MPILSILAGVGMFIQVMTLTGGEGLARHRPSWPCRAALLYAGIALGMPLFGGISAFGSASVLGVPFILALVSKNALITASALSAVVGTRRPHPPGGDGRPVLRPGRRREEFIRILSILSRPGPVRPGLGHRMLLDALDPGQVHLEESMEIVYRLIVLYFAVHIVLVLFVREKVFGNRPARPSFSFSSS